MSVLTAYGHMEFPGPGIDSKPQLLPCHICSNSRSFNPLCWARDGTHTSAETQATEVRFLTYSTTVGTPILRQFLITKTWASYIFPTRKDAESTSVEAQLSRGPHQVGEAS